MSRSIPHRFPFAMITLALMAAIPLGAAAQDEELARELLDAYDDVYRGESSIGTMSMTVQTSR